MIFDLYGQALERLRLMLDGLHDSDIVDLNLYAAGVFAPNESVRELLADIDDPLSLGPSRSVVTVGLVREAMARAEDRLRVTSPWPRPPKLAGSDARVYDVPEARVSDAFGCRGDGPVLFMSGLEPPIVQQVAEQFVTSVHGVQIADPFGERAQGKTLRCASAAASAGETPLQVRRLNDGDDSPLMVTGWRGKSAREVADLVERFADPEAVALRERARATARPPTLLAAQILMHAFSPSPDQFGVPRTLRNLREYVESVKLHAIAGQYPLDLLPELLRAQEYVDDFIATATLDQHVLVVVDTVPEELEAARRVVAEYASHF